VSTEGPIILWSNPAVAWIKGSIRPSSCAALATSRLKALSAARAARRAALRFRADCGADLRPLPPRVTARKRNVVGRAVARATPRRTANRSDYLAITS